MQQYRCGVTWVGAVGDTIKSCQAAGALACGLDAEKSPRAILTTAGGSGVAKHLILDLGCLLRGVHGVEICLCELCWSLACAQRQLHEGIAVNFRHTSAAVRVSPYS